MTTLVLYALLCASMFYLGSRSVITQALWSRYPPAFARFMDCPACTGFWYGLILALTIGWFQDLSFLGLPGGWMFTPIVVGLSMIAATPLVSGLMQRALDATGNAVVDGYHAWSSDQAFRKDFEEARDRLRAMDATITHGEIDGNDHT